MRFIHTSDWHLGRLFHGKHLTDDQAYVLEEFHAVVKETRPEAIIIAGDIYDRAVPPIEAVELLDDTLARLAMEAKVPVILIAGNHDSPERVGFGSKLLAKQGLHVVGRLEVTTPPVILTDTFGEVYFMPFTYAEPVVVKHVFGQSGMEDHERAMQFLIEERLAKTPDKVRKVAIAHTFIAGSLESESERPLSVGGSASVSSQLFAPFHYTALGHLHNSQRAGADHIRYSGSLLKYSFDEAKQKKGINIVTLDAAGKADIDIITLKPRYDVKVVDGCFHDILADAEKYPRTDDYTLVILRDTEPILDVHGQLEAIYPHLMQIERPYLTAGGNLERPAGDHRRLSEAALFASFFDQMTGEKLTELQEKEFNDSLDELFRTQREVR